MWSLNSVIVAIRPLVLHGSPFGSWCNSRCRSLCAGDLLRSDMHQGSQSAAGAQNGFRCIPRVHLATDLIGEGDEFLRMAERHRKGSQMLLKVAWACTLGLIHGFLQFK